MRSEERSATDWRNECERSSQEPRSCGTRSCHAAREARTRASSSPNRRSANWTAVRCPSGAGITSARSRQVSRGPSSMRYVTLEPSASPRSERTTCVSPWKPLSLTEKTNWLSSAS